jgi:hypothetical protein
MVKELKLGCLVLGCFVLDCIGLYWVVLGCLVWVDNSDYLFYFTHLESALVHIICTHTLTLVIITMFVFTHSFL